jgi:hypothetical protein
MSNESEIEKCGECKHDETEELTMSDEQYMEWVRGVIATENLERGVEERVVERFMEIWHHMKYLNFLILSGNDIVENFEQIIDKLEFLPAKE